MKNLPIFACGAVLAALSPASASLSVYEGFAVPPYSATNSPISGYLDNIPTPGSLGFTGAWSNGPGQTETSYGLSYGTLTKTGAGAQWGQQVSGRNQYNLAAPFTSSTTGTYYISWLQRASSDGFSAVEFYDAIVGDPERKLAATVSLGNWAVRVNEGSDISSGKSFTPNATVLYVVKLTLSATPGADTASFWVNPTSLGGAEPAGPVTVSSGFDFTMDRVGFASFGPAAAGFDEFRIGDTFADVTPVTPGYVAANAYDGFASPPYSNSGGDLTATVFTGANQPQGFINNWGGGSGAPVSNSAAALTYTGLGTTDTAGVSFPSPGRQQHALAVPFTNDLAGTYYLSWLAKSSGNGVFDFAALELYDGVVSDGARKLRAGLMDGNNFWAASFNEQTPVSSGVPFVANDTVLCVIKLTLSATPGADTASFWVNPASLGGSEPGGAVVINSGFDFTADRIGIAAFGVTYGFDEFRIGATYAAVTPNTLPTTGLQDFRTTNGLAADGSQDLLTPANDDVKNLTKYAFNMLGAGTGQAANLATPNVSVVGALGSAGLPRISVDGTGKLQITYIRRKSSSNSGITYTPQFGSSLSDFATNPSAVESPVSIDSVFERVTVTDSVLPPGKRFARVRISAP